MGIGGVEPGNELDVSPCECWTVHILVLHPLHSFMCTQVIQMAFTDADKKQIHADTQY